VTDYQSLAREAANESYGKYSVGEFSHTYQEAQDGVISYLFKSKLKGYPDWFISVTLFVSGWEATVSEVQLTPAETSLVAPKWVPWSERLADYKALQAAMEAEAAAAAALADESDDADDSDDEFDDASDEDANDTDAQASVNEGENLAVADVPEAPAAEDDADAAGGKSKGLFKWKTLRGKKKNK
jgi:Protein of unknown function (DUF3027)